uniref:Uncharacterized protein n=1 Tax=Arundo donax TaxID=35708 RepID=A0A0A9F7R5_ARUDO
MRHCQGRWTSYSPECSHWADWYTRTRRWSGTKRTPQGPPGRYSTEWRASWTAHRWHSGWRTTARRSKVSSLRRARSDRPAAAAAAARRGSRGGV